MDKTYICKVTGLKLTEFQHKTYGLFAGSLVRKLYKQNNRDINKTKELLHSYIFVEELNSYFEGWKDISVSLNKTTHNKEEIYNKYVLSKTKCCLVSCKNLIPFSMIAVGACCITHSNQQKKIKSGKLLPENFNIVCKECGISYYRKEDLSKHIKDVHDSEESYYHKHIQKTNELGKCLWCGNLMKFNSIWEGYNKFCYNTSCGVNYHNKYNNRSDCGEAISKTIQDTQCNSTQKGYWTKMGFTEEEAIQKLRERQTTNSIDAIMKRSGCNKTKAIEIRKGITEKWLTSFPKQNYSKVSQELFWNIYDNIKSEYKEIYFATIYDGNISTDGKNHEYKVKTHKTSRSLDFYIKDVNKVIEFNGAYWHSIANKQVNYRVENDQMREDEIVKTLKCKVFNVKELEYYKDKQKILQDCLDFIHND